MPVGRLATPVAVIAVLAALYLGREILMPLALATLVSFTLVGPVARVERMGLGHMWSVGLVVGGVAIVLSATCWMAFTQLQQVVDELPNHRSAIKEKVDALVNSFAAMEAAGQSLVPDDTAVLPADADDPGSKPAAGTTPETPLYMVATEGGPVLLRKLPAAIGSLLNPLGMAGMVGLFALFILLYREDLRNRLIRLVGRGDVTGTTLAINEASKRIGRFLGFQTLINGACGLAAALALYLLGVPGWALWGFLYGLLRFLPYVGPWIGAALPIAMALAASPDWGLFIATAAFFAALELLVNMVVEPWLQGESTGVSAFAVLVAAAFWTWLWGPVGLLLAMPLTAVVVVIGKSVPQLAFLNVLLGTDPVMSATDRFYQRVVGNDLDEAMRILEEVADDRPLADTYEEVLVAGLVAADRDRAEGKLTDDQYASVCDNIRDSLEETERKQPVPTATTTEKLAPPVAPAAAQDAGPRGAVVCVPVKAGATEVAAAVLVSLLRRAGYACRWLSHDASWTKPLEHAGEAETVCVVSLPDPTHRLVRAMCRRVVAQGAHLRVVVLAWRDPVDPSGFRYRSLVDCADAFATSAADLLAALSKPARTDQVADGRPRSPSAAS